MHPFENVCFDRLLPHDVRLSQHGPSQAVPALSFYRKVWPVGSVLRVKFMHNFSGAAKTEIMRQANWWSAVAAISFVQSTDNDSEIRITGDTDGGAWSFLGTDALAVPYDQPTMNLGFLTNGTPAHEFGHAISLGHEHQHPQFPYAWNETNVIHDLMGPPNNWTEAMVREFVFKRYEQDQIKGTEFDRLSIMAYRAPLSWFTDGHSIPLNTALSAVDKQFAALLYPKVVQPPPPPVDPPPPPPPPPPPVDPPPPPPPDGAVLLVVGAAPIVSRIAYAGEVKRFVVDIKKTAVYRMGTEGGTDTFMRLLTPEGRVLLSNNDSGPGLNAYIVGGLSSGKRYPIEVRHNNMSGVGDFTIGIK